MNTENIKNLSIAELVSSIEYHNRRYWEEGAPEISDDDYDLLLRELEERDPEHPLIEKVNAVSVASSGKVIHETPMLSLSKVYSLEELLEWANDKKLKRNAKEEFLIQPKYDGISANWHNGVLSTRGDGETGENITDKLELIELENPSGTMPLASWKADARGEIVIRSDDFKNLYSHIRNRNGRTYKNPRNAVAGIMGLKDISEMLLQGAKLTFVDYSLFSWSITLDKLAAEWNSILEHIENLPYPMDGAVVKLADKTYSESLGNTAHHPRGQTAFKFSGIRRSSVLRSVEWSFGKNCLTPVAEFDSVEIGGTTIKRATLHNFQNVLEKKLHLSDTITIERAGDVIPYIVSADSVTGGATSLIGKCPSCKSPLVRELPEIRCVNSECFMTKLKLLTASVKSIGIERLGEPNISKMMETLNVKNLGDIFNLTLNDVLRLESFKAKSADNLLREIENARRVPDWQLLASLNIPAIGPNIAKGILKKYTIDELRSMSSDELSKLEGIGTERAAALAETLDSQQEYIAELMKYIEVVITKNQHSISRPAICFTGKMPQKRSYYEKLAADAGYDAVDSVNSELAILVADDINGTSSKLKTARKLGIEIISLDDFLLRIKSPPPPKKTDIPVQDDLFGDF